LFPFHSLILSLLPYFYYDSKDYKIIEVWKKTTRFHEIDPQTRRQKIENRKQTFDF